VRSAIDMIVASGVVQWMLTPDEARLLSDYRIVRQQGRGSIHLELDESGRCVQYQVTLGGSARAMSALIARAKELLSSS